MNAPILRLFALFVVLFAVLIGFSSRWAVFGATGLRDNKHNSRVVLEEQRVKRGVIRAADGEVLAGSVPLSDGRYARRYPTGRLFAQPGGAEHGPARAEPDQHREEHHEEREEAEDRRVHDTGCLARLEISSSSASSTKFATIEDPP